MARTGYVYFDDLTKRWTARVTFTDSTGKKRNVRRVADSESKAQKLLRKLLNDLETKGEKTIDSEKMTFSELAEQYKAFKIKPSEYRNDKKIAGLRSYDKTAFRVAALISYFGKMRIRSITPGAILRFKEDRLNTKTKNRKERSIAPSSVSVAQCLWQ